MAEKNVQNDFSKGNIPAVVMRMALPLIAAQLVNVLYNVVDRIYIGHIPNVGSMALTGVGIALPVISILSAFAGLFGQGGAPLCSMARGRGDNDEASRVMGNAFSMLLVSSVALGLLTWAFLDPVITVFTAGKEASSYAREYLAVYLIGTTVSFVSLGMNVYINAQGFATRGMLTVLLGAAELLHEDGIEARVVKLNRISPFRGGELSRIFGTTKRLLVAEECSGVGCIGQRIAAILAEEGHEPQRLMLCNLGRRFIEQGSVGELYRQCGLDAESLARTAKEVCQ